MGYKGEGTFYTTCVYEDQLKGKDGRVGPKALKDLEFRRQFYRETGLERDDWWYLHNKALGRTIPLAPGSSQYGHTVPSARLGSGITTGGRSTK